MKTNYYTNFKEASIKQLFGLLCLVFMVFFSSCEKDNERSGASFSLKDNPTEIIASSQGTSETFTVQTTGEWKVQPIRTERWLKIEPAEGNGEGTFTVTVDRNTTLEPRTSVLTFVVDGRIQNHVLKIEQDARGEQTGDNESYLHLDGLTNLEVPEDGLFSRYVIRSTGEWKVEVIEGADWFKMEPMEGRFDTGVNVTVDVNATPDSRTARLAFYLDGEQLSDIFEVNQAGMEVVLFEDFNWLNYGNEIFNQTNGETRMGLWSVSELERGWTGTIPPPGTTNNPTYVSTYARPGFIKLGRTNYGGDLISPKLSAVEGTKNLEVSFKAVRYASGDHSLLKVGVTGPGTVSVNQFNVTNVANPNSSLDACRAAWQAPEAKYSFTITGATSETQVWFFAGEYYISTATGWPSNTNRIFLDDILIAVKK